MIYQTNGKENMMKIARRISHRIERKPARMYGVGVILGLILGLGFAVPVQAQAFPFDIGSGLEYINAANKYDTHVTLATITVPVRLHNFPSSAAFRVDCKVYGRNRHTLPAGGVSIPLSISNSVRHVSVPISPLRGASVTASQLASWQCFLFVNGKNSTSGLTQMHKSGTTYKPNVGGTF